MSNAGIPTRKRKRSELSEAHSSPPRSPSPPHLWQQRAQPPPAYPSEESTAQAGIDPTVVPPERDHTRPSVPATQVSLPSSINHPSSNKSHPYSQPFVQSWLESSTYGESPDKLASTPASPQPAASDLNPAQVLPLTRSNLRVHEKGIMPQSGKSKSCESSQPQNVPRLRHALDLNAIKPHRQDDKDTFPVIISQGKEIIGGEREGITMADKSAKKARTRQETHATNSETSFLIYFLQSAIIKENRTVMYTARDGVSDRCWEEDYILGVWDKRFISTALSGIITTNAKKDKATFDPKNVLSIPKPDITYGLMRNAFTEHELIVMERYVDLYQVSPGLVSPFFIVECKSYGPNIANAEIQAQRGGAALVCAQRQIDSLTNNLQDQDKMDTRSMVFSLCLDTNSAFLNVHYITIQEDGLRYHHHKVKGYTFVNEGSFEALRHDIWNIMDWGFGAHKQRIRDSLAILDKLDANEIWPKEKAIRKDSSSKATTPSTTT